MEDVDNQQQDIVTGQPQFLLDPEPISWVGPEYHHFGSSNRTIIASVILFVSAVLIWIFGGSLTTGLVFALFGFVVLLHGHHEPPEVTFHITTDAIHVHDKTFPAEDIESFWIHYHPHFDVHELSLHLKKWHKPYVRIPLHGVHPVQVREILLDSIPEEEHEEHIGDVITRLIGLR
jgi:hypothetical protein